ncbi:protein kinase [Colletotrichum kahawae]|uniref:Protein kinase n=1 Tax=Colletotrichum kahawae TaxID=34407 RepID=A0AAD9YGD7_COLKA|nr:protein kinase [Colletotrichum kahawae]
MIDTHLHLRQGLRRYKSRNELQDDQKSRDCEVQAPHCPPPKPLVIKPSGSLDIEFVSHSPALGPKEILHKTSQVGPLGAEKAVQYTAQKPYTDLMSSEPAMVMKNITSHELNQELPTSASELAEQFVEPSDSPLEEPQAVTVVSKNDKGAAASNSADRLDDNASTASLPTGSAEEDTAGVLTPIGADRPTDDHWEYNVDTKTGQVCFKRVPGPPEPWVISKQLVLNLLATGLPEAGSKDAQAWDQYNKKLREKKGLVAVPNASSLRIPASNQLSRKSSIHRQQGRLRAVHPRHPPKCHADQEKEFFRGSIEPVETSSSAANMESMTKSDNRN